MVAKKKTAFDRDFDKRMKSKEFAKEYKRAKKELEKKEEPTRVYLVYTETQTGGEYEDENDRWSSRADTHKTVNFKALYKEPPTFFYHSVEVDPSLLEKEELFMAVVYFSDGDTFGKTYGYWSVEGIYGSRKEARERLKEVLDPKYKGYKPWDCYFGGYMSDDVIGLELIG